MDALRAVLQAFRDRELEGDYDLVTLDTHYRMVEGVPTPGPGITPTATPAGPTPTATPTVPPPTPAPGDGTLWIFQESLAAPWIDTSWSASVDYASAVRAFTGSRSIRVAEIGWGGLSLRRGSWSATQPIDPAGFASVDFAIFPEGSGMSVGVQLENDAGQAFPLVTTGPAAPGAWKSISVPMSQLNPAGLPFDRVDVLNANGTDIDYSVDDLRIVAADATPTPRPTGTPPPEPTATAAPEPTATAAPEPTATAEPTTAVPTATVPMPTATPQVPTPTPTGPAATPTAALPTPTPPAPAGQLLYEEALVSPWIDASWTATVSFDSTLRAFRGTRSIRVAQTGWGALSLHRGPWTATQPLDPADWASVDFMVFSETGNFDVSVRLENDARQPFPEIATGVVPPNTWTRISVPIDTLDPGGLPFDRVDVRNFRGTNVTYFVDDLMLVPR